MNLIIDQIENWLRTILINGITNSLSGVFDSVNTRVGDIANIVGTTPGDFSPEVFALIQNISETVIMPIAGIILTFICCWELIQIIIDHNNLANFETWIFFKWIFKTFIAVVLITNCFDITMAVFDVAQHVIDSSGSLISSDTAVDEAMLDTLIETLNDMDLASLIALYLSSFLIRIAMLILSLIIFVIVYGRMLEIYLMVSLAPIPFSTFCNREQSQIGQNYLRSLIALGFQGFLILVCVGIYAVLIQTVPAAEQPTKALWEIGGYTVLLVFCLFKTGSLSKSILSAH